VRAAVTGGSGVVGSAVLRHLLADGHEVRALARSDRSARLLEGRGATVVRGDVLDPLSLVELVTGCDHVFHVAGVNEMCSRHPSRMWRVNVEGTLHVLEASARAGVERLVHTSSAVTLGEERGTTGSEGSAHRGHFLSEYERSKTVAERLVFDVSRDIEVVSVNPSSVQGPGRSTGTASLLLAAARGRLALLVDTMISLVDIDDCARGHLLAAEHGTPGRRYVLSGATLSIREAVRKLGRSARSPWYVDPAVVTALAPIADRLSRMAGIRSQLCAESARVLLHGHRYDGSRATRELGLEYTGLDDTLERTVGWFRGQGLL
jgi:dihydroflavonol-4-reductase